MGLGKGCTCKSRSDVLQRRAPDSVTDAGTSPLGILNLVGECRDVDFWAHENHCIDTELDVGGL